MPLSTITHYSATTAGKKGADAHGRRKTVGIQNLDATNTLRYWLLTDAEAKKTVPAPTDPTTGYKEIGPGQERVWDRGVPENTLYYAGVGGTVVVAEEIKLEAGA